jgi:hypothetical protein
MRTVVILLLATAGLSAAAAEFDHSPWTALLSRHVNAIGEVDYAALKASRQPLDAYIAALAAASPDSRKEMFPNRAAELAYWLNAYNALTAKGVVDNYPTRSVRDLGAIYAFFRRNDYTLGGVAISLRYLENDIIRKRYQDPRIHFALVCASISCPLLAREAFTAARLEEQLDRLTRASLAENRNAAIDAKTGTLTLTSLFKWYAADFGPALAYIRRYSTPERLRLLDQLGPNPPVRFFDYDWSINEPGSRAKARLGYERELAQSH